MRNTQKDILKLDYLFPLEKNHLAIKSKQQLNQLSFFYDHEEKKESFLVS